MLVRWCSQSPNRCVIQQDWLVWSVETISIETSISAMKDWSRPSGNVPSTMNSLVIRSWPLSVHGSEYPPTTPTRQPSALGVSFPALVKLKLEWFYEASVCPSSFRVPQIASDLVREDQACPPLLHSNCHVQRWRQRRSLLLEFIHCSTTQWFLNLIAEWENEYMSENRNSESNLMSISSKLIK